MSSHPKFHSIYFTGIRGVAMTAFAIYAHEHGWKVAGSDVEGDFPTNDALFRLGISVQTGFGPGNIPSDCDLLVYTGAHGGKDNPQVKEAIGRNIPALPHGKALGMMMDGYRQICIAGSHGKTTTSAWIAQLLSKAGADPSWAIGAGMILPDSNPGHFGSGTGAFVAEADEYVTDPGHDGTPRFLWQNPEIAVVTNIDYDHPDAYGSLEDVQEAFVRFAKKSHTCIYNRDDVPSAVLSSLDPMIECITYGTASDAFFRLTNITYHPGYSTLSVSMGGSAIGDFSISVPGLHNALNFLSVLATCWRYGMNIERIREFSGSFIGTKRRCEVIQRDNPMIIDDYAHHPHEIRATLEGLMNWYPGRRVIAVFQPHTYSRTKALLSDFSSSFTNASIAIIADIYASARETDTLGIAAGDLVTRITQNGKISRYGGSYDGVKKILHSIQKPDDIIVFMGAGDIYSWSRKYALE